MRRQVLEILLVPVLLSSACHRTHTEPRAEASAPLVESESAAPTDEPGSAAPDAVEPRAIPPRLHDALFEYTCLHARLRDGETLDRGVEQVYARYDYDESSFEAALERHHGPQLTRELAARMQDCDEAAALGFAGAGD